MLAPRSQEVPIRALSVSIICSRHDFLSASLTWIDWILEEALWRAVIIASFFASNVWMVSLSRPLNGTLPLGLSSSRNSSMVNSRRLMVSWSNSSERLEEVWATSRVLTRFSSPLAFHLEIHFILHQLIDPPSHLVLIASPCLHLVFEIKRIGPHDKLFLPHRNCIQLLLNIEESQLSLSNAEFLFKLIDVRNVLLNLDFAVGPIFLKIGSPFII